MTTSGVRILGALAFAALLGSGCAVEGDAVEDDLGAEQLALCEGPDTVTVAQALWNPHNPQGQFFIEARSSAGNPLQVYYWSDSGGEGPLIGLLSEWGSGFFNPPAGRPEQVEVRSPCASAVVSVDIVGEP